MPENKFFNVRNVLIGIFVIVGIIFAVQMTAQRGLQGRLRDASFQGRLASSTDSVGDQFAMAGGGATLQSEPYYASSAKAVASAPMSAPVERKLIKTASINVKVKNCDQAQMAIAALIMRFNGVVINSQVNRPADYAKSGTTVFRVPPKDLDVVMAELRRLGEVESENVTGEDVTEQYVDLEARLNNFKVVRDRLLKIMDERAREVRDILEVERELARVGGEIESIEGRMKYLDRQVDLSTVTVYFHEEQVVAAQAFHFLDRFKSTIRAAVDAFVNSFNGVIVVIGFLLPLIIWAGIFWGAFLLWKAVFIKKVKK